MSCRRCLNTSRLCLSQFGVPTLHGPSNQQSLPPAHLALFAGSTGRPKGVIVSHESVVNTLDFEIGLRRKRGLGKDDPCIQLMSVFADLSGALEAQMLLL